MSFGPVTSINAAAGVPILITFPTAFTTVQDALGDYSYVITAIAHGDPNTAGAYAVTKAPGSLTITPSVFAQDITVTVTPYTVLTGSEGVVAPFKIIGPVAKLNQTAGVAFSITFATPFTTKLDTLGDYQYVITENVHGDQNTHGSYSLVKSASALTITPISVAQDFSITIIPYNQTSVLQGINPLSVRMQAIDLWTQAVEDVRADTSELNHNERFMLINRAILSVIGKFYGLVDKDYNTRAAVDIVGLLSATEGIVDISGLPIMRLGQQIRMTLETPQSSNGYAEPRTEEEYMSFRSGNSRDRSNIIYVARPDELRLKKGDDITSWGLAYVWFPRIPIAVSADLDWLDLPDVLLEVVTFKLAMLVRQRMGLPTGEVQAEVDKMVASLSQAFGQSQSEEELKAKVMALS